MLVLNYTIYDKIFRWLKFSPKAHTMYWDKNFAKFNVANRASYLPGSCEWSLRVAMHKCAYTHDRLNVSKFSLCKKVVEIGENFLLVKFPRTWYCNNLKDETVAKHEGY